MNKRFIGVLTFAFIVALGASLVLYRVLKNRPGDTVAAKSSVSIVLASRDLEVLSACQDFKKDAEGKPMAVQVVNMLVTPEQAEQLSLASSQTSIQLVLRNPLDHAISKTPGT